MKTVQVLESDNGWVFSSLFWPHCTACGILLPDQESKLHPLHLKHGVFTAGPPGKFPDLSRFESQPKYLWDACSWASYFSEFTKLSETASPICLSVSRSYRRHLLSSVPILFSFYWLTVILNPGSHWNWASLVAQMVKSLPAMQETWVQSLSWEDPLEKGMVTHSSILAWRIPRTEEPGVL